MVSVSRAGGRVAVPARGENRAPPPALLRKPTTIVRLSSSYYIEEDPMAFLLPPFAAREVGRAPFHLTREGQRRASHLLETPAPLDTHVDVHTARARGLGPATQPVVTENVSYQLRHPPHRVPAHARAGVEIHA